MPKGFAPRLRDLKARPLIFGGLGKGTIRIGAFSSVATYWLPSIIAAFQKDHPGISYQLKLGDYEEIEGWINDGEVDCGFLSIPCKTPLDCSIPWPRMRRWWFCRRAIPLCAKEKITLKTSRPIRSSCSRTRKKKNSPLMEERLARHPLPELGRLFDHGDGGEGARPQRAPFFDSQTLALSSGDETVGSAVLPGDWCRGKGSSQTQRCREMLLTYLPHKDDWPRFQRDKIIENVYLKMK
jgi:DNA-binding transcriptional LysR family regulator